MSKKCHGFYPIGGITNFYCYPDNNNASHSMDFNDIQNYAAFSQTQFYTTTATTSTSQSELKNSSNQTFFQLLHMAPLHVQPEMSPSPSNSSSYTTQQDISETPMRVTRPPNAYLLFNKEQRKILKEQDPSMKVADISKQIGLRWKNMPKEEKATYIQQANKLKEEKKALYPNAMYIRRSKAELIKAGRLHPATATMTSTAMQQKQQQQQPTKRRKAKKEKNANVPKHPLSAYMWYLTEVRPDVMHNFPGSNVGQISKLCADQWNIMTEQQKSPWISKAQADKVRYAREMQNYAIHHDTTLGRGTRQKYRPAQSTVMMEEFNVSSPTSILNNYHCINK